MELFFWRVRVAVRGLPGFMVGILIGRSGVSLAVGLFMIEVDV